MITIITMTMMASRQIRLPDKDNNRRTDFGRQMTQQRLNRIQDFQCKRRQGDQMKGERNSGEGSEQNMD